VGGRAPGIGSVLELDVEAGFRDRPGELAAGRLRRGGEVVALGRALEEIDDPLAPKLRRRQLDHEQADRGREREACTGVAWCPTGATSGPRRVERLGKGRPAAGRQPAEHEDERVSELLLHLEQHRCVGELRVGTDQPQALVAPEPVAREQARDLRGRAAGRSKYHRWTRVTARSSQAAASSIARWPPPFRPTGRSSFAGQGATTSSCGTDTAPS
jgi:hypothetical protein